MKKDNNLNKISITEKQLEDIICKYPEIIEKGLKLLQRQYKVDNKFIDILFQDRYKDKLIIELKRGTIKRGDLGQILDYEGYFVEKEATIRVMLVGNKVPQNIKKALDHHGIEYKEISDSILKDLCKKKRDLEFLKYFENDHKQTQTISKKQGIIKESSKGLIDSKADTKIQFRGHKTSLVRCFHCLGYTFDDLKSFYQWKYKIGTPPSFRNWTQEWYRCKQAEKTLQNGRNEEEAIIKASDKNMNVLTGFRALGILSAAKVLLGSIDVIEQSDVKLWNNDIVIWRKL